MATSSTNRIYLEAAQKALQGGAVLANRDRYNTLGQLHGITGVIDGISTGLGNENGGTAGIVNRGVGAALNLSNLGNMSTVGQIQTGLNAVQTGNEISGALGGNTFTANQSAAIGQAGKGIGAAGAIYNTINNWDDMTPAQRALSGGNAAYQSAQAVNALGSSAATTGTAAAASNTGATAGAQMTGSMAGVGQALGAVAAVYAGYQVYKNAGDWDQMSRGRGTVNGAAAGASIGTAIMPGAGTAIGAAIGAIAGFAGTYWSTGKSKGESERHQLRKALSKVGFLEGDVDDSSDKGNVYLTLANGNKFDVSGEDWEGDFIKDANGNVIKDTLKQAKAVYDPSRLDMSNPFVAEQSEKDRLRLRPYNVDNTCDLDMFTSVAANGLQKAMFGAKEGQQFEKMMGYMTNAATSSAASRDFTEENFTESMANMKAFAIKAGFKDEASFTANAKQLLDAEKIDTDAYSQMLQASAFIYRGDFKLAKDIKDSNDKLAQGA